MDNKKILNIADHFSKIMLELGLDLEDPSLKNTPLRVAKMYVNELCSGLDPGNKPEMTTFPNKKKDNQIVLIKDISLVSMCEHHFVPFIGKVHIAYLPGSKMLGLSKFSRGVQYLSSKPQVQERLTDEIGEFFTVELGTKNVAAVVIAKHMCCSIRGIKDINTYTTTSYVGGAFRDPSMKSEFFELLKLSNP